MDELIRESLSNLNVIDSVTTVNLVWTLILSTGLSAILCKAYMVSHSGYSYSKTYVQSLILITLTIALIMIIIGSNIARAFALVGAMSIVRFRNPVKDTRDLVFVFIAIAIGMACGTKFYLFAVIFTAFILGLVTLFEYTEFGKMPLTSFVIKVKSVKNTRSHITEILSKSCSRCSLVSIDSIDSERDESIYEIKLGKGQEYEDVVEKLNKTTEILSIQLLVGESRVNV
jgi:hypothetical protein